MSIGFSVYGLEKTPGNVLREAGNSVLYYGRIVFTSLIDLLRGRESINNLSGPVGIVTAIGQAASYGWYIWALKASPAMLCRKSCKACSPLQPSGCCSG